MRSARASLGKPALGSAPGSSLSDPVQIIAGCDDDAPGHWQRRQHEPLDATRARRGPAGPAHHERDAGGGLDTLGYDERRVLAGFREMGSAAADRAERQARIAERGLRRTIRLQPRPVNRDRSELDVLDQSDHRRPPAAFGMAQPGARRTIRRDRQRQATREPVPLKDRAGSDGQRLVAPEIERIGDALWDSSSAARLLAISAGSGTCAAPLS